MDVRGSRFLRVLVGGQLRLSVTCASVLIVGLALVPAAELLAPGAVATRIAGMPVSVWMPLLLALPLSTGVALVYVRNANDYEDEALGLVDVTTLPTGSVESPTSDPVGLT
jgi:hypothetical protein